MQEDSVSLVTNQSSQTLEGVRGTRRNTSLRYTLHLSRRTAQPLTAMAARPGPGPGSLGDKLQEMGLSLRREFSRLVFAIDDTQEERMRAYLKDTYGADSTAEERAIRMDALRCAPALPRGVTTRCRWDTVGSAFAGGVALPLGRGGLCSAEWRHAAELRNCRLDSPRHGRRPAATPRVVPPPTSLDEEMARRLYEQLEAARVLEANAEAEVRAEEGRERKGR